MADRHELKTINPWFQLSINKQKSFEIRVNDRDFKPGDDLILREYNVATSQYSGREVLVKVVSVVSLNDLLSSIGLSKQYENMVIMSIEYGET